MRAAELAERCPLLRGRATYHHAMRGRGGRSPRRRSGCSSPFARGGREGGYGRGCCEACSPEDLPVIELERAIAPVTSTRVAKQAPAAGERQPGCALARRASTSRPGNPPATEAAHRWSARPAPATPLRDCEHAFVVSIKGRPGGWLRRALESGNLASASPGPKASRSGGATACASYGRPRTSRSTAAACPKWNSS